MQIRNIAAENFLSYEQFSLALADRGLLLVEGENRDSGGSNGAGKSAIFEALTWCIFGFLNRAIKGDEVVRLGPDKKPLKNCRVQVDIDLDGTAVRIIRHRRHAQFGNKLLAFVDGKEITMGGDRETQERLEQLLQIDSDAFINSVMFPQGAAGFASLTDAEQKDILDRILSTQRFGEAQERVKTKVRKLQEAHTRVRATRAARQQQILQITSNIANLQQQEQTFEQNKAAKVATASQQLMQLELLAPPVDPTLDHQISQCVQQYEALNIQAQYQQQLEKQQAFQENDKRLAAEQARLTTLQQQLSAAGPEPEAPPHDLEMLVDRAQKLSAKVSVGRATLSNKDRELNAARQKQLQRDAVKDCSTCGQALTEDAKNRMFGQYAEQVKALQEQRDQLQQELDNDQALLNASGPSVAALQKKAETWRTWKARTEPAAAIPQLVESVNMLSAVVRHCRSEFEAAVAAYKVSYDQAAAINTTLTALKKQKQDEQQALATWQLQVTNLRNQLQQAQNEQSPYTALIIKAENDLDSASTAIGISEMVERKVTEDLTYLDFWVEGFGNSGVKSLLLDTVAPYLSYRASNYLEALTGGTASIEFRTQKTLKTGDTRDKLEVCAQYSFGGSNYNSVSGGERRRVDLACLFALGDLAASRSFAPLRLKFLDEPFDNLDSEGAQQVVHLLKTEVLPNTGTILVVSHSSEMQSLIDNRIRVVKQNGISRIEH